MAKIHIQATVLSISVHQTEIRPNRGGKSVLQRPDKCKWLIKLYPTSENYHRICEPVFWITSSAKTGCCSFAVGPLVPRVKYFKYTWWQCCRVEDDVCTNEWKESIHLADCWEGWVLKLYGTQSSKQMPGKCVNLVLRTLHIYTTQARIIYHLNLY